MRIIDCKAIAAKVLNESTVEKLKGRVLHVVMKNQNPDNLSYLKSIYKIAKKYDVTVPVYSLPENLPLSQGANVVLGTELLPDNEKVLFLGFNEEEVTELYQSSESIGSILQVLDNPLRRSAVWAVLMALAYALTDEMNEPQKTVVIGRSDLAKDCGTKLLKYNHTVTFVHTKTEGMVDYLREADNIVSFAGSPNLITGDMVKDGATVISVGCALAGGVLCGDIDMDSMKEKKVFVTAPTGGIGALTTALLFAELAE